jgi:DNA-binding LytR/AlgR family response regulator
MIKALIIEDEVPAVERLTQLLKKSKYDVSILETLDSVKAAVQWFNSNPAPDVAFFDIQLADGKSFEIFNQIKVRCPIIFTTAYDQYAIQAFKVNSVDYLLKPLNEEELSKALDKFKTRTSPEVSIDPKELLALFQNQSKSYKERFVVKVGEHLKSVQTSDARVFFSSDKATYVSTIAGQKFILDFTLDHLEDILDPKLFFRISRKYVVHVDAIKDILVYSSSRLKLTLHAFDADDIIVARERVNEFKAWLDR